MWPTVYHIQTLMNSSREDLQSFEALPEQLEVQAHQFNYLPSPTIAEVSAINQERITVDNERQFQNIFYPEHGFASERNISSLGSRDERVLSSESSAVITAGEAPNTQSPPQVINQTINNTYIINFFVDPNQVPRRSDGPPPSPNKNLACQSPIFEKNIAQAKINQNNQQADLSGMLLNQQEIEKIIDANTFTLKEHMLEGLIQPALLTFSQKQQSAQTVKIERLVPNKEHSAERGGKKLNGFAALKRRQTVSEIIEEVEQSPAIEDSVKRIPTSKYLKNANKKVIEKLLKSRLKTF